MSDCFFDSETLSVPSTGEIQTTTTSDYNSSAPTEPATSKGSEICYITDDAGIILSLDDNLWNTFISQNTESPAPAHIRRCQFPSIVGRVSFWNLKAI